MVENDYEFDYLFKVVLVGKSGVGKSGCLTRYYKNEFNNNTKTTIGVEFASKNILIDNSNIKVQIWDTAGQERYRAITSAYYRGGEGIILVYDITNRESFIDIERWRADAFSYNDKSNMLLLGNKKDLSHLRAVSTEEGKKYANEKSMLFCEVSALNGENIETAINILIEKIYFRVSKYNTSYAVPDNRPVVVPISVTTINKNKKSCCS